MADSSPANLVTSCTFKGREYLVKLDVINGTSLELVVTDKLTAEDWSCSYDATYIENQTHKTGNFKQFDIFVTMLRSGLLKTRESVSLDLLTVDDLELLRSRRTLHGRNPCTPRTFGLNQLSPRSNRRYLILTYTVEFDRIHYPLPLEYCGPPDPKILQAVIRRLESEVARLQEQLRNTSDPSRKAEQIKLLEQRVGELSSENRTLRDKISSMNKSSSASIHTNRKLESLQQGMRSLEEHVQKERLSFNKLICRLREEKKDLSTQVRVLQSSENGLRKRLNTMMQRNSLNGNLYREASKPGDRMFPRSRSRSSEIAKLLGEAPTRSEEIPSKWHGSPKNHKSKNTAPHNLEVFYTKNKNEPPNRHRSVSASSTESRRQQIQFLSARNIISCSNPAAMRGQNQRGRTRLRENNHRRSAGSVKSPESFHSCEGKSKSRPGSVNSIASSKSTSSQHHSSRHSMPAGGRKATQSTSQANTHKVRKEAAARRMIVNDLETRINVLQDVLKGDKTYR